MLQKWPDIPVCYLLHGITATRLGDKATAYNSLREGLNKKLDDQCDTKTCLLFALAGVTSDQTARESLLEQAISLKGNLNCYAMAYVTKVLQLQ
jgi:hypothetical protein